MGPSTSTGIETPADPAAVFADLYEAHGSRIYAFLYRRLGSAPDAQDLTADVFVQAWRQRDRVVIDPDRGWLPWLYAVARNLARSHHRGTVPTPVDHTTALDSRFGVTVDHAQALVDGDADQRAVRQARRALRMLSEPDQTVIELCVLGDLTPSQAGIVLGQRPSSVRSRLTRATRRLRAAYDGLEVER